MFQGPDQSHKRYVVMKGSAGSGKSMDTAQHYILRLMKDPGTQPGVRQKGRCNKQR